jgi:hypothetical protein
LKAIPISIAHTLVFFIPYYLYTESVSMFGIFLTSAYFIHHMYQISISGDIKDIDQDEASLLKKLGAKLNDVETHNVNFLLTSNKVLILGYGLAVIQMFLTYAAMYSVGSVSSTVVIGTVFGALMMYDTDNMLQPGQFQRTKRLEYISRREFFGYSMIHSASILYIGLEGFAILLVCMLVYLGTVSKFIWGNWLVPEV